MIFPIVIPTVAFCIPDSIAIVIACFLSIPNTFGENITITIVELSSGKIVQQLDAYNGTYPIDLFGLANGVYILNIVSDENVASRKLIMAR